MMIISMNYEKIFTHLILLSSYLHFNNYKSCLIRKETSILFYDCFHYYFLNTHIIYFLHITIIPYKPIKNDIIDLSVKNLDKGKQNLVGF